MWQTCPGVALPTPSAMRSVRQPDLPLGSSLRSRTEHASRPRIACHNDTCRRIRRQAGAIQLAVGRTGPVLRALSSLDIGLMSQDRHLARHISNPMEGRTAMTTAEDAAAAFDGHRGYLTSVAYRMLGPL